MSDNYLKLFIKSVDVLLAERQLSKTDLAKMLGVSRQTVGQYLSGEHSPSLDKIVKIAEALGVPPFVLLMSPLEKAKWDLFCAPSATPSEIAASYAALKTPEPKKKKR